MLPGIGHYHYPHLFKGFTNSLLQDLEPNLSTDKNSFPIGAKLVESLIYASLPLSGLSMVGTVLTLILP